MKLILKILFFVLATFQTNISETKVIVFADVSEPIFSNAFYLEKSEDRLRNVFLENDLINTCKSESDLLVYRSLVSSSNAKAAKWVTNLIPEGKLANHLFKGAGKLADNPANRTLIQNISNGKALGVDAFGKSWYTGLDAAGKSIYSYGQNGIIKGAGYINMTPAEMIIKYGLK